MLEAVNWGSVADWLVLGTAVIATSIARSQLKAAATAATDQAQIARAMLILELDRDYESSEMKDSRMALRSLRNEIESFTRRQNPALDNDALHDEMNKQFSQYMNFLWRDFRQADRDVNNGSVESLVDAHLENLAQAPDTIQPHERAGTQYLRLTQILGWLERVAHLVHQGLVPKADIILLYDALFMEMGQWFAGHIKLRQEDGPKPNRGFMRLTLELCREIEERNQAVENEANRIPINGGVSAYRNS